jgi:hypothetical protein
VTAARYSPEETAKRGQSIYDHALLAQLEPRHRGEVVAIDIDSEAYEVASDVLAACEKLLARIPDAEIWVVRVGRPAVYHLGCSKGWLADTSGYDEETWDGLKTALEANRGSFAHSSGTSVHTR